MYETFGDATTPYFEGTTFEESTAFLKVSDLASYGCGALDFADRDPHRARQTLGFEFTAYEHFAREKVAPDFAA